MSETLTALRYPIGVADGVPGDAWEAVAGQLPDGEHKTDEWQPQSFDGQDDTGELSSRNTVVGAAEGVTGPAWEAYVLQQREAREVVAPCAGAAAVTAEMPTSLPQETAQAAEPVRVYLGPLTRRQDLDRRRALPASDPESLLNPATWPELFGTPPHEFHTHGEQHDGKTRAPGRSAKKW